MKETKIDSLDSRSNKNTKQARTNSSELSYPPLVVFLSVCDRRFRLQRPKFSRCDNPILEPETPYEKIGEVNNVVFPCGMALLEEKLFVYYGGGDKVIGIATIEVDKLLNILKPHKH